MNRLVATANFGLMALFLAQTDSCIVNLALPGDAGSGAGGVMSQTIFEANLTGAGSSTGRARYDVSTSQKRFDVEVESGTPGAVLDIVVDGVQVDQLTLDAFGFGEVEYRDPPDDNPSANEFPFPSGFPKVMEGTVVTVGDLSGVMAPVADTSSGGSSSNGDDSTGGQDSQILTLLTGNLNGSSTSSSGQVRYEVRSDRTRFDVEVESGTPGAVLDIVVDGVMVDQLTLDSLGFGEVEYKDPPDDNPSPNEFGFPTGFPSVMDGTVVTVGDLTTTLATSSTSTGGGGSSPGDNSSGGSGGGGNVLSALSASLTAMGSSSSGTARYEVRSDRTRLTVEVESGTPGAVLDIVVDGVMVDQLTLDSLGFGEVEYQDPPDDNPSPNEFPFPANMPTIQDGTVVQAGSLSGTLAP